MRIYTSKPAEELRGSRIDIPVTAAFLARLDAVAAEWGMKRTEYCRTKLEEAVDGYELVTRRKAAP